MIDPNYTLVTAVDCSDLLAINNPLVVESWPEFMLHDAVAGLHWNDLFHRFPEYQFSLLDQDTQKVIAAGNCIPLAWDGDPSQLPDKGWDWALAQGVDDLANGRQPHTLCALQIMVAGSHRGKKLSSQIIEIMKKIGSDNGLKRLIAPVRPNFKSRYPLTSMNNYIKWENSHGLPFDPWLRVHFRMGAEIINVCPQAMHISGSITQWEQWTEMPLPESGRYIIPGALVPVEIDRNADTGIYVEPNVWMVHRQA
ncbi:MAG: GNAT family N-acetyltransferase [candidate division Zixibacteria bacterium]|nr:GNAT family N-acetyltransferase [candidate division Zixibacteria bacterium]